MGESPARSRQVYLCEQVELGKPVGFGARESIDPDIIRSLLLGLSCEGKKYSVPSVGLRLKGATIERRLELDDAVTPDGEPLPALEFRDCVFNGGFSGTNSHFSRLSFVGCRFRGSPRDEDGKLSATIDLGGASLGSDFRVQDARPVGKDHLWIAASGTRIDGKLNLSGVLLRAPPDSKKVSPSDTPFAALDLSGAEVRGDFWFIDGSKSEGTIRARGVTITGDVWMSGAQIARPGKAALFFQGATIGGLMMLDSRAEESDDFGQVRRFRCVGDLNLVAAELGRDLHLNNSIIVGNAKLSDLRVKNDLFLGARVGGHVNLPGCRIGGTLDLSNLSLASTSEGLDLGDGRIGRTLRLIDSVEEGRDRHVLIAARRATLASLPGVEFIESLWDYQIETDEHEAIQIGFLARDDRLFRLDSDAGALEEAVGRFGHDLSEGRVREYLRIHCTYGQIGGASPIVTSSKAGMGCPPFLKAIAGSRGQTLKRIGKGFFEIETERKASRYRVTACALERDRIVRRTFTVAEDEGIVVHSRLASKIQGQGMPRSGLRVAGMPRHEGANIRHPVMGAAAVEKALADRIWVTAETVQGMANLRGADLEAIGIRLAPHVLSSVSLHGKVGLENLSCDMLDDSGGRYWGRELEEIRMNHFVYNRASWEPDLDRRTPAAVPPSTTKRPDRWREWAKAGAEKYRAAKGSLWKKVRRGAAELLPVWFTDWRGWTDGLRLGDHWTPWEIRRNWIYQQFGTARIKHLPSPARYRINSSEYRPQPFEQAIKVARSEGREDFAIHFEILKRNIEWRLFSRRNWEWFLFLGLFAALAWLVFYRANLSVEIVIAAIAIGTVLTFISAICHRIMDWLFGHLRRPVRAIATLVIAFLLGWAGVHAANERGMMVIDVDPVATLVGENQKVMVIGSPRQADIQNLASDVHCGDRISEALYALDVLVPLIDLREESRCEVGQALPVEGFDRGGLMGFFESLTPGPTTFWEVLKAIYAIAGWFIVSLSILTFAQITRSRGD